MTLARTTHASRRAFTLLEVLIAVAAFAIVLAAINGVFYSALRLRNRSAASLEKSLPLQHALLILKRDLANIAPPGGTLTGEFQASAVSTSQPGQGVMSDTGTQVGPQFKTLTGLLDDSVPWPTMQKVTYMLMTSTNGNGKDLYRTVTRNLLPAVAEAAPVEQFLLGGVEDVAFLYYDGTDWIDSWDSTTAATKLPHAIMVQIQLVTEQGQPAPAPIELVVPLVVEASTNQTSQASQSAGGQQ